MKFYILIPSLLLSFVFSSTLWAETKEVTLEVSGMTCWTCPFTVKSSLNKIKGVSNVEVSRDTASATITFEDSQTDVAALIEATTNAGYPSKFSPKS